MSTLIKRQRIKLGPKTYTENGRTLRIIAHVRHDDECGNGYNTFSITCDIQEKCGNNRWYEHSGGCCHEDFVKHFPEHAHLLRWHLMSTDGPMHYLANTVYLASDKDHNGRRKGDVSRYAYGVRFGNSPVTHTLRSPYTTSSKTALALVTFTFTLSLTVKPTSRESTILNPSIPL